MKKSVRVVKKSKSFYDSTRKDEKRVKHFKKGRKARVIGQIHCANCLHCKLVYRWENGVYVARVRCAAGKWQKPSGEEKLYRYDTVGRRIQESCNRYVSMGEDVKDFLAWLIDVQDVKQTLMKNSMQR